MNYYLGKKDWTNFAKYYVLYFDTAATRSEYPVNNVSFMLFEHVTNPHALEAAIKAEKCSLDLTTILGTPGKDDPSEVDTYASLLYKTGKTQEAITWEEKAAQLSEHRDQEILDHLAKMRAGQPTWSAD
jgi:hypothetical protein